MNHFGNARQEEYARDLSKRAGFPSLEDAISHFTGRPTVILEVTPFDRAEASKIITSLESKLGIVRPQRTSDPNPSAEAKSDPPAKSRFLTPRQLRRIATHQDPVPEDLDDDARWVLSCLARLGSIEYMVGRGTPSIPIAVNGNAPIGTAHLIQFFGSPAAAAAAFGVSEKTFAGWGELVPTAHVWRAEVATSGYVTVPKASQ